MLRGVDATSAGETLNAPEQNINTRSQPEQQQSSSRWTRHRWRGRGNEATRRRGDEATQRNATRRTNERKEPKPTEGSRRQSDRLNGQTAAPLQHWTPNSVDRVRPDWQTNESREASRESSRNELLHLCRISQNEAHACATTNRTIPLPLPGRRDQGLNRNGSQCGRNLLL